MHTAEAKTLIADIAGPLRLGDNVKLILNRVARATGLGERRVRGLWNEEARAIRADEMDRLREVAAEARAREEARRAYRAVNASIALGEQALGVPRPHGGGDGVAAVGAQPRALDRAMDRGV